MWEKKTAFLHVTPWTCEGTLTLFIYSCTSITLSHPFLSHTHTHHSFSAQLFRHKNTILECFHFLQIWVNCMFSIFYTVFLFICFTHSSYLLSVSHSFLTVTTVGIFIPDFSSIQIVQTILLAKESSIQVFRWSFPTNLLWRSE